MDVWVEGKRIRLTRNHFVAQGGEASVYAHKGMAYKVYHDETKVVDSEKIAELNRIASPRVIQPEVSIFSQEGLRLGYRMRHVPNAYACCQLFPKAFRQRHGITQSGIERLVLQMREGIKSVHEAGVLLVDGNEMNFLVSSDFKELYFVDVDSYQTPSFPATALMQSIADPLVRDRGFSQESDWFAFAVVAFQMCIGIHPYKGKHPRCKGLSARMSAGISVFDSEVRLPGAIGVISDIPANYLQWFREVFVEGKRLPPPTIFSNTAALRGIKKAIPRESSLVVSVQEELSETLLGRWEHGGMVFYATRSAIWQGKRRCCDLPIGFEGIVTAPGGKGLALTLEDGIVRFYDVAKKQWLARQGRASAVCVYEGRGFLHSGEHVFEVSGKTIGNTLTIESRRVAQVLPYATQLLSGVALQSLLGTPYLSLFTGVGRAHQIAVPQLQSIRVVEAQLESKVLVLTGYKGVSLQRFVFRFAEDFLGYDLRIEEDVDIATVNLAVLHSGVCVLAIGGEKLEIFHSKSGDSRLDCLSKTGISLDMKLASQGNQLLALQDNRVLKVSMT